MTLATVDSLSHGLDYEDIMRRFLEWYEQGRYTAHHEVFDIGNVTRRALRSYDGTKPAYECGGARERDNGNGSLMRILPFVFYCKSTFTDGFYLTEEGFSIVHKASKMTHAHPISQIACGIYASVAMLLCDVRQSVDLQEGVRAAFRYYRKHPDFIGWIERFQRIEHLDELDESQIKSTSYVVDTLEAALWCLLTTDSYQDCILKAVNLGDDTDTVAAVAGGLAGLKYGMDRIPKHWYDQIAGIEQIEEMCTALYKGCLRRDAQRFMPYLIYFEKKKGRDICRWRGVDQVTENVFAMSYPAYEQQVYDLMETVFPHSMFVEPDYQEILKQRGIENPEVGFLTLNQADLELLCALLTYVSVRERFEEGYWNQVAKHGILYQLLNRICKEVVK